MQYKFYIYKQSTLSCFDKYNFNHYTLWRQITNNAQWSLKIDRDNEWFTIIRTKFNGEISVSGADFTALIALESSQLQYCVQIQEYCGTWREKWKGYFSYFDYKVNSDRCQLTFEPSVWDVYTPIFDQMDIERNIIGADTQTEMPFYGWGRGVESISYYQSLPAQLDAVWVEYPGSPIPAPNYYYLYSQVTKLEFKNGVCTGNVDVYQVYKRDVGYTSDDSIPPSPGPGDNWVLVPGEYSPGVYKWVRPVGNSVYQTYAKQVMGNGTYEVLQYTKAYIKFIKGLLKLNKVLDYFASYFNITYVSNLFYDDPCPMGGTTLKLAMIQQISNLRSTEESATIGLLKLKDLLIWIRDTFNAYWYIDSNGDFRIEHRKYFDQGFSYTTYFPIIELDLRAYPDNIKHLNKYGWNKPSLYRYETLQILNGGDVDWLYSQIEYPQTFIEGNSTKTVTVEWMTDIMNLWEIRADLQKKGWALYDVQPDDVAFVIPQVIGAISGVAFPNARFAPANLLRDFWTWGRLLPTGNVNGVATTFDSYEKLRKQVELTIPQCCLQLDYNGIFKTELGNGLMESGELDNKGNLKLNLIYE
ncbi:MAG: hypothetical protein WC998_06380 [Candidatus Paceibacterota bacterium]|jgi:hypothetical protein